MLYSFLQRTEKPSARHKQMDRELIMKSGYKTTVGDTYHSDLIKFLNEK